MQTIILEFLVNFRSLLTGVVSEVVEGQRKIILGVACCAGDRCWETWARVYPNTAIDDGLVA